MTFDHISVEATQKHGCKVQVNPTVGMHTHKSKDVMASLESSFANYVTKVDGWFDKIESCINGL